MAQVRRPFRFVHTADLHLDSPLELREDEVAKRLDGATRRALSRLIDLCIDERVDALLIAGDLYDGTHKSATTAAQLSLEMRRLRDAGIHVFMIRGNHDATSSLTRTLDLPDNVHVFDGHGRPYEIDDLDTVIHGVSFNKPHINESLLPKYKAPVNDRWNIGLMHTSIDGSDNHDRYAPCSLRSLVDHGYDYWALGHIHRRRIHSTEPAVVMPGIPQGRHIKESGPCSVTLVTLNKNQPPHLEERQVRVVTFDRLDINVTGSVDRTDVLDTLAAALEQRVDSNDDTQLILRLRLSGSTPAAFSLLDAPERLLEEVRGIARRHPLLSIEKIDQQIENPRQPTSDSENALPLDALFADDIVQGPASQTLVEQEWEQALRFLPAAHRELLGASADERAALQSELLHEGINRVRARLSQGVNDAD